jgi:hypothetical protein
LIVGPNLFLANVPDIGLGILFWVLRIHFFPETKIILPEFKNIRNERITYHRVGIEPQD